MNFLSIAKVLGGLQPYYLHFPPPVFPVPNGLEPVDFSRSPWPSSNSTFSRSFPDGPFPLIIHTWVKPDTSNGVKLENGTIIYYLPPPWGGIRSVSPTTISSSKTKTIPNSLYDSDDYSSSGGKEVERQSLFEDPSRQVGYTAPAGWQVPNVDITTPPPAPSRSEGPWGHGHLGFGWSTSTQLYDKLSETTTSTNPFRTQIDNSTATVYKSIDTTLNYTATTPSPPTEVQTTGTTITRISTTTTTTEDPVAASTNARYPVSDSVRKFRRIVAQIRAITRKELGAQRKARR